MPCRRPDRRGHRLGAHRVALRRARPDRTVAGGGTQSGGRGRDDVGARRGPGHRRPDRRTRRHLPAAQRAGRVAVPAGQVRRGGGRVLPGGEHGAQRSRARRPHRQGRKGQGMTTTRAVLFDYSGTLFRLEGDESWFTGIQVDERAIDGHVQAELMRRLTAPTGASVDMDERAYEAWVNRDLAPHLHREAYLHVLRESGLADHHAETLYDKVIDPISWTPYPDTAAVLAGLHRQGIRTAVVSNIAFDVRPAFARLGATEDGDEFVLSFEVGAVKPSAGIFQTALARLGVAAEDALMVGDSQEADGGAVAVGCRVAPR